MPHLNPRFYHSENRSGGATLEVYSYVRIEKLFLFQLIPKLIHTLFGNNFRNISSATKNIIPI